MKRIIQAMAVAMLSCLLAVLVACSGQSALPDGTYSTTVDTDSSMFRVEECELTVADGAMTAVVTLPGQGFSRIYMGSAQDAPSAPDAEISTYTLDTAGKYTFVLPVSALDTEIPVSAYGQRRDTWYDHTMLFHAPEVQALEPAAAGQAALPQSGEHDAAVTLAGGSGKASVESPAKIVFEDGKMTATIVWSSPNYDQMIVDGVQYLPVNESGNSTFVIPVSALDEDIAVQAETTAMSKPHMIDYTLHFDSASLR